MDTYKHLIASPHRRSFTLLIAFSLAISLLAAYAPESSAYTFRPASGDDQYSWYFKMQGAEQDCTWKNFKKEKRKSKLKLASKVYPGFDNSIDYERTDFERRMYIYGAYKQSNIEGENSAVVIPWLLRYAEHLDRGRAPNFEAVVADINDRVQKLSTEEQSKILPVITTFPAVTLHTDREVHTIPLVYTALSICDKPGITIDETIPQRLLWIQGKFYGDWDEVKPDPRREKCVLDVTKKSVELFDNQNPHSKQAVVAHEHLAHVYDVQSQQNNQAAEYLKVLQLNTEGAKGELPSDHVFRSLVELYTNEKLFGELSAAIKKYSGAISTSTEALQSARQVTEIAKAGALDTATLLAVDIFPKLSFEEPKEAPRTQSSNVFQLTGCQLVPRCYSQPSWYLSGWINLMCEAGSKAQAQHLYDECIAAALKAEKQDTKEFQLSVDCATAYSLKKAATTKSPAKD